MSKSNDDAKQQLTWHSVLPFDQQSVGQSTRKESSVLL